MPLPPSELAQRASRVQLLVFDVDGVLTDGTVVVGPDGWEAKPFFIRDGAGIVMAQREGLPVGLLSGRPSAATAQRAAELGIDLVVQGGPDKRAAFARILEDRRLDGSDVAYMGDDLLDLPILRQVGLSAAPADATQDVLSRVHWVSTLAGGRGAVREFIELILRSRGRWDALVSGLQDS